MRASLRFPPRGTAAYTVVSRFLETAATRFRLVHGSSKRTATRFHLQGSFIRPPLLKMVVFHLVFLQKQPKVVAFEHHTSSVGLGVML